MTAADVDPEQQNTPEEKPVAVEPIKPGDGDPKVEVKEQPLTPPIVAFCIFAGLACLLLFLVGLTLFGNSFKAAAGGAGASLFGIVKDPIAGLMVGVLATVLVQSSSTSTSIVVALVSADAIQVVNAIPIIMGANIGTSVTNTIVAMGQSGNKIDLERSFAGATVHDMFNLLTVALLLPLEAIIGAAEGTGGPLYWITHGITSGMMGGEGGSALFKSPIKIITGPIAELFLKSNKYIIYAQTLNKPAAVTPTEICSGVCKPIDGVSATNCSQSDDSRRLTEDSSGNDYSRALLSTRRLADDDEKEILKDVDCGEYACMSKALAKNYKKASSKAYAKLVKCEDALPGKLCSGDPCYLGGAAYYDKEITNGRLIKKGFLKGAGDTGGGIIGIIFAVVFMSLGLIGLCKALQRIFLGKAKVLLQKATKLNDYIAILIGVGITIVVQSSSVTTSALTPLCGMGVLPLKKMLPLTLGANIGTTCTALIAACVDLKFNGVQIALAHLLFNIIGILVWFPVPYTRAIPLAGARTLGTYAANYRFVPPLYILVAFIGMPGLFLGLSQSFYFHVALGVVLLLIIIAVLGVFEFWWWKGIPGVAGGECGAFKVLSQEEREKTRKELIDTQAALMGITPEEYEKEENRLSWTGN